MVKYITSSIAKAIDAELMDPSKGGFTIYQLMELAGFAVAEACFKTFPPQKHSHALVVCGPGNNGGDGLVAARHMKHFGYDNVSILYPKETDKELYLGLLLQNRNLGNLVVNEIPELSKFDFVVDAIFGFSFSNSGSKIRSPYDSILAALSGTCVPIISVDVPSGWDVDKEIQDMKSTLKLINPKVLVSLTAPKLCAKSFIGEHYVGGRFIPREMEIKYDLDLPSYGDCQQITRINK